MKDLNTHAVYTFTLLLYNWFIIATYYELFHGHMVKQVILGNNDKVGRGIRQKYSIYIIMEGQQTNCLNLL